MARRLIIEADGGSRGNPGLAGYGAVVRDAVTGDVLAEVHESIGHATNNVAEYSGLLAGLRAAGQLATQASQAARALGRVTYTWVPRERNTHADRLANQAMDALTRP